MSQTLYGSVAVIGIDIGKNSFHVVGLDARGAIVLRQKWSRGQIEARLANTPRCLIGMEACVGAHHLSRKLRAFGRPGRIFMYRNRSGHRAVRCLPRTSQDQGYDPSLQPRQRYRAASQAQVCNMASVFFGSNPYGTAEGATRRKVVPPAGGNSAIQR